MAQYDYNTFWSVEGGISRLENLSGAIIRVDEIEDFLAWKTMNRPFEPGDKVQIIEGYHKSRFAWIVHAEDRFAWINFGKIYNNSTPYYGSLINIQAIAHRNWTEEDIRKST